MGVDVASMRNLHVRISEHINGARRSRCSSGRWTSFNELPKLMEMYRVHMASIDHLPEGRLARSLRGKVPRARVPRELRDRGAERRAQDRARISAACRCGGRRRATRRSTRAVEAELPTAGFAGELCGAHDGTGPLRREGRDGKGDRRLRLDWARTTTSWPSFTTWSRPSFSGYASRRRDSASTRRLRRLDEHFEFERSRLHDPDGALQPRPTR